MDTSKLCGTQSNKILGGRGIDILYETKLKLWYCCSYKHLAILFLVLRFGCPKYGGLN